MTDLDRALHSTLTRVAEEDVHVERLLAGARASGIRYRRRRRIGLGVGASVSAGAAVLALSMTVTAAVGRSAGPGPAPGSGSSAAPPSAPPRFTPTPSAVPMTTVPTPPVVAGGVSAADSAAEVGRPLRLHLSLDRAPFPTDDAQYQQLIGARQELLTVDGTDHGRGRELTVRVGATTQDWEPLSGTHQAVVVGGRPGTLAGDARNVVLRWRAANGLWLQVAGARDAAEASAVAAGVRLDRTYRCAAPYRLPSLPATMKPESCSVVFHGGTAGSMLSVTDKTFSILVTTEAGRVAQPNEKLGGRPARVVQHAGDGGAPIMEVTVDEDGAVLSLTASGQYDPAVVRRIAADCDWTGGSDPSTWR
ncbi:hypothetical protein [Actinoplanes subtropicus]|uniref:hypothetical protein n=1 Tax=Actinoplanes subtropicus TaxID=543632 RepID=UPI0004C2CF9D|nr:hypothetical protein [Actinoplanes subtropicus]